MKQHFSFTFFFLLFPLWLCCKTSATKPRCLRSSAFYRAPYLLPFSQAFCCCNVGGKIDTNTAFHKTDDQLLTLQISNQWFVKIEN